MGFESAATNVSVKSASWILLPTLYITIFFLLCMVGYDIFGSQGVIEKGNLSPLIQGTLFNIFGADHKLGFLLDHNVFSHQYNSITTSFSGFFDWLFERLAFWFNVLELVWFIYVIIFLLYHLVAFVGGEVMPPLNKIIFVVVIFLFLQIIAGAFMYSYLNHDLACTGSGTDCMMLVVNHSLPFEGVYSLIKHTINRDLFNNVHQLQVKNNPIIRAISGIPNNISGVA